MTTGMEFSDLSKEQNGHTHAVTFTKHQGGCYVTRGKAFLLFLAAAIACVIVGVTVYYAHPDYDKKDSKSGSLEMETDSRETMPPPGVTPDAGMTSTTEPMDVRLPDDLVPIHYNVQLRPDIYQADPKEFMFNGIVDAYLEVKTPTNVVQLHIKKLTIDYDSITIMNTNDGTFIDVDVDNIREIPEAVEFLLIPTKSELPVGATIIVHIAFTGPLLKDLHGIYYSDYINDENEKVFLLTSQLQATDARKIFPCLDEPALKASFNVTLERKASHTTKCNMEIIETVPLEDGWFADVYDTTPVMSTYLLAFLVSDFRCTSRRTKTNVLVEICARPNAYRQLEFANSIAVEMQEWFEEYHNLSYPLSKMTHVAVPDFSAGAMENWGLIVYRETALLYDPATSSANNKQRVAVVVSHELAHMWFGDLVTPMWWDDIWLNEGFASYMENQGIHNVFDFDTWTMEENFVAEDMQYVMKLDSLTTSHPIYQSVNHPDEISEIFDAITYYKGSAVIRMMRYFLGDDTFRFGLSNYLKDNIYSATFHDVLFKGMTDQATADGKDIDVGAILNTWILQMGFPVVKLTYDQSTGSLMLTQKHFLLDPTQNVTQVSPYNYIWKVPFTIMYDTTSLDMLNSLEINWFETKELIMSNMPSSTWFIANVNQQFYYYVNYDIDNWNALIAQLQSNHLLIPRPNRAQIIDDIFNLASAGETDIVLAMRSTQYLSAEDEYTPWYSLSQNIKYIRFMLSKGSGKELLDTYMQGLVSERYNELGSVDRPTDSHLELRHRSLMLALACRYQLPECLAAASAEFATWVQGNYSSISVNFASTIQCYGIQEGGPTEWEQGYHRMRTSNSGTERRSLIYALGCTKETWLLERYLHWGLAEDEYGLGQQDMRDVLVAVARNPLGTHIAWSFFKANWHIFCDRFCESTFTLSSMIGGLTETFSTDWELSDLHDFVQRNPNLGTGQRRFQQAIESTTANIQWRNNHEQSIIEWLESVN